MSDYTLTATTPLAGLDKELGGVHLREATGKALVSIAIPQGGQSELEQALDKAWQVAIPAVGHSVLTADGSNRLMAMQADQLFLLADYEGDQAVAMVAEQLGDSGYYTDQSDSWAMLQVSGTASRKALERICPIDLHADVFAEGAVARTAMEHMGVIIVRNGKDSFLLLTMRSLAGSLLHAVEVSVNNVT